MGAWGTSLYANDSASDIRGDYVDMLRRGMTNESVTQELIEKNSDIIGDVEEEPLFWFALADTQWNYGRLLPEVKEKALYFLSLDAELERWKESGEKKLKAWIETLSKLRGKLNSEPPPPKKIYCYRLYKCKWCFGDVFAYCFDGEYSKQKGFYKHYVVFRKVSEDNCWPGHIVPVVQVYKWIGKVIPTIDELSSMKLLEQGFYPETLKYKPDIEKEYLISLLSTSEKGIPKDKLMFLGNVYGEDIIPFKGYDYLTNYTSVGWEGSSWNNTFEKYIIDMYLAWEDQSDQSGDGTKPLKKCHT